MNISKSTNGNIIYLALSGRLDSITSLQLSDELNTLFQSAAISLVFDFSELDYISSAGLRVLLTVQKKVNILGTKLKVIGATPVVKEVFDVTGFSGIIEIE